MSLLLTKSKSSRKIDRKLSPLNPLADEERTGRRSKAKIMGASRTSASPLSIVTIAANEGGKSKISTQNLSEIDSDARFECYAMCLSAPEHQKWENELPVTEIVSASDLYTDIPPDTSIFSNSLNVITQVGQPAGIKITKLAIIKPIQLAVSSRYAAAIETLRNVSSSFSQQDLRTYTKIVDSTRQYKQSKKSSPFRWTSWHHEFTEKFNEMSEISTSPNRLSSPLKYTSNYSSPVISQIQVTIT